MQDDFRNELVISFESRRAAEMGALVERCGGRLLSAPAIQELPLSATPEIEAYFDGLKAGDFDMVLLLTGVGANYLGRAYGVSKHQEAHGGSYPELLATTRLVCRGPKPVRVLKEMGLTPEAVADAPNTWEQLLAKLDEMGGIDGLRIAVQEYRKSNPDLIAGLEARGAVVTSVPIYASGLPEDLGPLEKAIDAIISGDAAYVLFTSSAQPDNLFEVAKKLGKAEALLEGFKRVCVGSIGPVTSPAIRACGFQEDYEPDLSKFAHLIQDFARRGAYLLEKKRVAAANGVNTNQWERTDMDWSAAGAQAAGYPARSIADSVFMKACRCEPVPHTPVWIMRQAGRYQRHYRQMRAPYTMVEFCHASQVASEVTLMAIDRLGVDAAIIFQDILLPLECLGFELEYVKGYGPKIHNPFRVKDDLARLKDGDASELDYINDAVRMTRKALRPDLALIGFCGAPFTVASYAIEGGKSKNYQHTKTMMFANRELYDGLMQKLVPLLTQSLIDQLDAGADAVQIFDSWAGSLSPDDYREFVLPYIQQMVAGVQAKHPDAPIINFATGNTALVPLLGEAGAPVVGLDWRCDLADGRAQLGEGVAVQGNLDPVTIYADNTTIRRRVTDILEKNAGRPGHIFNLGHGVSPDMDPRKVDVIIDTVHGYSV